MPFNNSSNNLFREKKVVKSAVNYAALEDDVIINITDTSTPRTVKLPLPSKDNIGKTFLIKDASGAASTHNIEVSGVSGNIDGSSKFIIDHDYGSASFYSDGSDYSIENKSVATSTTIDPLTAGGVMFADGSQVTQNSDHLHWDNNKKRFGINTKSPEGPFEVDGFIKTASSSVTLTNKMQTFTPLTGSGIYFFNCKHPNGCYFNFVVLMALVPSKYHNVTIMGSSDYSFATNKTSSQDIATQGNLHHIFRIDNDKYSAWIQSTNQQITINVNEYNGAFEMKFVTDKPCGTFHFQAIKYGSEF